MSRYKRPEINIKIIRAAAKLLFEGCGGNEDRRLGVRCMRDLCINSVRLRRKYIREWQRANKEERG